MSNGEEKKPMLRIDNGSSLNINNVEIEVYSLNSLDDFWNGEADTTYLSRFDLISGEVSDGFDIPGNSVFLKMDFLISGKRAIRYSQFDVFPENVENPPELTEYRKLKNETYTLGLFDRYLYSYNPFQKDSAASDSIWVRVVNRTNTAITNFELFLDQEKPEDPDDIVSRNQVDQRKYNIGDLAENEFSEYVTTELLFEDPRRFTFNAREQEARVGNPNFEMYFYDGKPELGTGYYTLSIINDRIFLDTEVLIRSDNYNVEN